MKENSEEEYMEKLEELYQIQDARLACGADDLDIREEIAEVEEKNKELQDKTNEENSNEIECSSIEEDIKVLEKLKNKEIYEYNLPICSNLRSLCIK